MVDSGREPDSTNGEAKSGMSTGKKVAIGCGVLVLLAVLAVGAAVTVGGLFLKDRAETFVEGIEEQGRAQEEAGAIVEELRAEYPFDPPEDGVVGQDRARRFLAVTDEAWGELEAWADDLDALEERMEGRESPRVSDIMAGMENMGRLARSRLVLAQAMEEHDMPPEEYIWTGLALSRAYENLDSGSSDPGVPEQNMDVARRHREELAEIVEETGDTDRGAVLGLAVFWGMTDMSAWEAMGLDTMRIRQQ